MQDFLQQQQRSPLESTGDCTIKYNNKKKTETLKQQQIPTLLCT